MTLPSATLTLLPPNMSAVVAMTVRSARRANVPDDITTEDLLNLNWDHLASHMIAAAMADMDAPTMQELADMLRLAGHDVSPRG